MPLSFIFVWGEVGELSKGKLFESKSLIYMVFILFTNEKFSFGSVVYFNNSYYAKNELDDLPTQIHYCVNDLSLYRSETSDVI